MYEAISIAASGIVAQQRRLDTIADNLSNINTGGFKASRLDFKDALYTTGIVPGLPRTPEGNQQKGHGVTLSSVTMSIKTGNLIITGNDFDVAIEGDGFFELADNNGNLVYTRNGSFALATVEDGGYVMNHAGYYVLDENGEHIRVPEGVSKVEIDDKGVLRMLGDDGNELIDLEAKLGIRSFRNATGLISIGGGNYIQTETSGESFLSEGVIVRQGMLEGSNVSMPEEITRMIRTQKAFTLASRALKTADEMEGMANSMKK